MAQSTFVQVCKGIGNAVNFKCTNCGLETLNFSEIQTHVQVQHAHHHLYTLRNPPKDFNYKCTLCPKKYIRHYNLRRHHAKTHSKSFRCEICSKCFCNARDLSIHMLRHPSVTPSPTPSEKCEANFKIEGDLNGYIQRTQIKPISKERTETEDGSDKKFKIEENLYQEMEVQHSKQLICNLCSAVFRRESNFERHKLEHWNSQPLLECAGCTEKFHTSDQLKYHLEFSGHSPKMFKCEECDVGFSQQEDLRIHLQEHHHHNTILGF